MYSFFKKRRSLDLEMDPDEVLLDSTQTLSTGIDERLELPLSSKAIYLLSLCFSILALILLFQIGRIQIIEGQVYAQQSENNRLARTPIFAERGVIYDSNKKLLAWNDYRQEDDDFFDRRYSDQSGLAHVLGYIRTPLKDNFGIYYQDYYEGLDGVEKIYDEFLSGQNGLAFIERNALGEIQSENIVDRAVAGESLHLSIDKRLQSALYEIIKNTAETVDFKGGAGVLMDIETGEIVTLVSYPEFNSEIMSNRSDTEAIEAFIHDQQNPFLNRAVAGTFTPGSVMKLFMAVAALEEKVIDPNREIVSGQNIIIPNPYNPTNPSIFSDWRIHGRVDMRRALAVSSNIYFYHVGGGFGDVNGLGISRIESYMRKFGFGQKTGINIPGEKSGIIPNPDWKAEVFSDGVWRLGDTYNTSIGQFGFAITPIQLTRAVAGIAHGQSLVQPTLISGQSPKRQPLSISPESMNIVREGMLMAVKDGSGTARGLNTPYINVAAKTGTAELGIRKDRVNSWITGYFPYEEPRYAFTIMMENGPSSNLIGGVSVMRRWLDWINLNAPEYLQ